MEEEKPIEFKLKSELKGIKQELIITQIKEYKYKKIIFLEDKKEYEQGHILKW